MKTSHFCLAATLLLPCSTFAQGIYAGLGLPGLYTLGYAHSAGANWGLRGEYATGLSARTSGSDSGVNYEAVLKASRTALYADWFPFGGGFRLVGGITANDMSLDLNSVGTGNATINGNTVSMAGRYFNLNIKYPTTTPYLGIGYGHHAKAGKGLGFYADVGMSFGTFTADVSTNLVGVTGSSGAITQADIDAQKQQMNDSLAGLKYLPSVSLGLVYRY